MSLSSQQNGTKSPARYKEESVAAGVAVDLHHPHAVQQGLPPPNHLQHSRQAVASPHQPPGQRSALPYASPHSATHGIPPQQQHQQHQQQQHQQQQQHSQHQSAYGITGGPSQHPEQVPYFQQAHPSPYSTNSAAGSYTSSGQYPPSSEEKHLLDPQLRSANNGERRLGARTNGNLTSQAETPELMATATMNRQYNAPLYHTPQSASPSSVQSPQHDQHGRPLYQQPMYYPSYPVQQSPYAPHHGPQQPAPITTNFMSQAPGQPQQYHTSHPVTPALTGSPGSKGPGPQLQRQGTGMSPVTGTPTGPPGSIQNMHAGPQSGPGINPNAAPGPIPATTPLVVRQDNNGVQWIAFEYSRDRVKMEYTIRCDVESVDVNSLAHEFKTENCVYPRACCAKDQYKGNRLHYETECNTVGWALAQLNPCLRGKRGLIQRAVDSWRNSNQDPRLRSRRVRRMAKLNNRRSAAAAQPSVSHMGAPPTPQSSVGPGPTGMTPVARSGPAPPMAMGGPSQMHHHHASGAPEQGVSAGGEYHDPRGAAAPPHQQSGPLPPSNASVHGHVGAHDVRQAHNFYPSYPATPATSVLPSLPPTHDMGQHGHAVPRTIAGASSGGKRRSSSSAPSGRGRGSTNIIEDADGGDDDAETTTALFGDLPEAKRRKFILVDDVQRGTRVRVRVMLDQVRMAEMPDSYRRGNSVFPRSWFATEMQDDDARGARGRWADDWDDEDAESGSGATAVAAGDADGENGVRTLVPLRMSDGSEAKVPLPRMSRSRRKREVTLNDLGYRMSWSQSRVFSGRTLFLQRSLDAYRNKMRATMVASGQDVANTAPHFETRIGKRKWQERAKKVRGREGSS